MPKPETKFWHELKRTTPQITWTRLENASLLGTPDLLGYNNHIRHPKNTFILVKTKDACRLYLGKQVKELFACGCSLEPVACGWTDTRLWLESLGQ
jgi:hypothetical protein